MESEVVTRLLAKLSTFVARELDTEEREALARLLAPGVSMAFGDTEVAGYEMADWPADDLSTALAEALSRSRLRVEGLTG